MYCLYIKISTILWLKLNQDVVSLPYIDNIISITGIQKIGFL